MYCGYYTYVPHSTNYVIKEFNNAHHLWKHINCVYVHTYIRTYVQHTYILTYV